MKTVDTRGHLCPMPIIMVKAAMKDIEGTIDLQVLTDNEISKNNLLAFFRDHQNATTCVKVDNHWLITASAVSRLIENVTSVSIGGSEGEHKHADYTVVLKNNKMGIGDDELGNILLKGFFNTLADIPNPPKRMIFYNNGALLVKKGSPFVESLTKLSQKGVDIFICGACVDFFGLKEDIAVGMVTNMYAICEMLEQTDKVIYP